MLSIGNFMYIVLERSNVKIFEKFLENCEKVSKITFTKNPIRTNKIQMFKKKKLHKFCQWHLTF